MHPKFAIALLPLLALSGNANAGAATYSPTMGGGSKTDTKAYAGLNWEIPGSIAPALVVGVRRAKVESDGDTRGGDLSFAVGLAGGVKPGKLRLKGFTGQENYQFELGAGYDFASNGMFAGPGINLPYVNAGVDWQASSGLTPNVMLHTVGKYKKPVGTPTCNPGDTYNSGTGLCEVAAIP